jgi:hypothetical protein
MYSLSLSLPHPHVLWIFHLQKYSIDFDEIWFRGGKKINLSLCLINGAARHEDVWGSRGIAPPFLTSALNGSEWSVSRPGPRGKSPPCPWMGDWFRGVYNKIVRRI